MKHSIERKGIATVFAPVLAVWIFLGLVGGVAAQDVDAEMARQYADQSLRVSVWLDKDADQVYRRGEPLQLSFQTNEDSYAVVYHIDVDGRVAVLWPTTRYSDGFVFGGHQYRLPSRDGDRLRVGDEAGVGYVQAVVSRYPFDLRELALDFHHENGTTVYDYYVAGDPFLAMNEVNYAVTGLEDTSAYAVTNYVSYYVHQKVDHPRYLCFQCHDDADYAPYQDTCTVSIHYDYGWMNRWWTTYGYYPTYYYPTYYYVDPWTGGRWVNYWYDPWYRWPVVVVYDWRSPCYDWHYSPYWRHDAWTSYEQGRRRYTPLDRSTLGRDREGALVRTKNELVTAERPADDRLRRMRDRVVADRGDDGSGDTRLRNDRPAGGTPRDVAPVSRSQTRYEPDRRIRTSPGLRVPDQGGSGERVIRGGDTGARDDRAVRTGSTNLRPDVPTANRDDGRQTIRPVEPRGDSGRVWTNRRSSGSTNVRPQTPAQRTTKPSDRTSTVRRPSKPTPPPTGARSGGSSGGTSVRRTPQQSSPRPSAPPPSRPSNGGGSRGGKSSGGRTSGGRG